MNFLRKSLLFLKKEFSAGGIDPVWSISCLPSADVEGMGTARLNESVPMGIVRHAPENGLILFLEMTP